MGLVVIVVSSILGVQRQLRELGRLRLGDKDPDRGFPISLDTWRLTSPNPNLIEAAAELWGGEMEPWDEKKFQVVTEVKGLPVRVAPQTPAPEFKLYPGPQRRCDGVTAWIAQEGAMIESECLCDPADRECKPEVLLKFFLPDLPDLGVWVYTSTAYTALRELVPAVEMMAGTEVDLSLVIEQRESRQVAGTPLKKFSVATLQSKMSMRSLLESDQGDFGPVPMVQSVTPALPPSGDVVVLPPIERTVGEDTELAGGGATTEVPQLMEDMGTVIELGEKAREQAWVHLYAELDNEPDGTMDTNESALRSLFRRMEQVGLWGEADRTLHAVLRKDGLAHVRDMKAPELREFCKRAWSAAREAVKNHEDCWPKN